MTKKSRKYHARPSRDECIAIERASVVTLVEAKGRGLKPCSCFDILGYVPTEAPAPWELDASG